MLLLELKYLTFIVLTVNSSLEDLNSSESSKNTINAHSYSEDSGGVINMYPSRVEYVNRIRHCGLGGFEYYDNMLMTVNERFIAVNTKTGNLLTKGEGTGPPRCEGLFVVDLEDCQSTFSDINS